MPFDHEFEIKGSPKMITASPKEKRTPRNIQPVSGCADTVVHVAQDVRQSVKNTVEKQPEPQPEAISQEQQQLIEQSFEDYWTL
ncbi:MAG: hypothetical protein R3C18_08325 [Planctomycetaceae bacterium]